MVRMLSVVMLLIFSLPFLAICAEVEFAPFASPEFNPSRGEEFRIPVKLSKEAEVSVTIFTADGDPIATLAKVETLNPGSHEFLWDGKDAQGVIVPDDAYVPVLSAKLRDGKTIDIDPRTFSGGEVVEDLNVEVTSTQEIIYYLPAPSRVLIRVGVKNGPMMRSLVNWVPKATGKNIQRWNGFDADNLIDLRNNERLSVLVTAYRLPKYSFASIGNDKLSYVEYRSKKAFPEAIRDISGIELERDGKRISRNYYMPRFKDLDPKVLMAFVGNIQKTVEGIPILEDSTTIKVDIPEEDRRLIEESLYEVAFFVDGEFVSEEEQGYMPITWSYKPVGLTSGNHTLTVNVSSLSGQVGVKSLLFNVPNKAQLAESGSALYLSQADPEFLIGQGE